MLGGPRPLVTVSSLQASEQPIASTELYGRAQPAFVALAQPTTLRQGLYSAFPRPVEVNLNTPGARRRIR
jgi:hypothetical protein